MKFHHTLIINNMTVWWAPISNIQNIVTDTHYLFIKGRIKSQWRQAAPLIPSHLFSIVVQMELLQTARKEINRCLLPFTCFNDDELWWELCIYSSVIKHQCDSANPSSFFLMLSSVCAESFLCFCRAEIVSTLSVLWPLGWGATGSKQCWGMWDPI